MSSVLPAVDRGAVAVWNVWIGRTPDDQTVQTVLSDEELARASNFVFDVQRHRYLAGRLALRELLGRYLNRAPSEIVFGYSEYGKPEVLGDTLRFNVAHSDDLAVIGLTEHDRLGIDLERVRDLPDLDAVAKSVFSARELDVFHALPETSKTRGFFNCWTRKEAFVKAVGQGLYHPLDVFDVTLRPEDDAQLLAIEGSTTRAREWTLFDLSPSEGWVGAVAVENAVAAMRLAGWWGPPPP